jgi:hypothetical protein
VTIYLRHQSVRFDASGSAGRRGDDVPRSSTPPGIAIAMGAVTVVAAGIIAALVPGTDPGQRFAVMAIAVGVFTAISLDARAVAATAVLAFAVSNGFLEDRFGQLAWHGFHDLTRLLLLAVAATGGLAIGAAVRFVRRRARRRAAAPLTDAAFARWADSLAVGGPMVGWAGPPWDSSIGPHRIGSANAGSAGVGSGTISPTITDLGTVSSGPDGDSDADRTGRTIPQFP